METPEKDIFRQVRVPPIDTTITDFSISVQSPATPPNHHLASPGFLHSQRSLRSSQPAKSKKARTEYLSLLTHLISQLESRDMPPPLCEILESSRGQLSNDNLSDFAKNSGGGHGNQGRPAQPAKLATEDSDDEQYQDNFFSTEGTFNLAIQMKDVLFTSIAQGWHVFGDDDESIGETQFDGIVPNSSSYFRRSRSKGQPGGVRLRSSSPLPGRHIQPSELRSACVSILSSMVLEDCRYKIVSPRPSRPPNALQSIVLDIARLLIQALRCDHSLLLRIGLAIIPAFSTFPLEMHGRLLQFFEVVLRNMFEDSQGITPKYPQLASLSTRNLSTLTTPLIATILESVNFAGGADVSYRFRRLIDLIMDKKPDASRDFLHIVAYCTPKARSQAFKMLAALWPRTVGHTVLTRPLDTVWKAQSKTAELPVLPPASQPHHHQFVPWRFSYDSESSLIYDFHSNHCVPCGKVLSNFGLLCPFCMCAVHFDCFNHPEGSHLIQYASVADPRTRRVAMHRFSGVLTNGSGSTVETISRCGHQFRRINLFTLTLCFICQKPLWGSTVQGWNCTYCMHFAHSNCLSSNPRLPTCPSEYCHSDNVTIDWVDFCSSYKSYYHDILDLSGEESDNLSFEEVNIIYATAWTQIQLLINGIALGSIVIMKDGEILDHEKLDHFDAHFIVNWCESRLSCDGLPCSNALNQYISGNKLERQHHLLMYDWSTLVFICSFIKLPDVSDSVRSRMNLNDFNIISDSPPILQPVLYSHSHMRTKLERYFNIRSQIVASTVLSHMNQIGLFDGTYVGPVSFKDQNVDYTFPLPLGLDTSSDMETLITAVEMCLSDFDLSVNEGGFLLLRRGLWPNGFSSKLILQRLTNAIVCWILSEDNTLATVLREYLTKQMPLPGVPSAEDSDSWSVFRSLRFKQSNSNTNGGDYIATRRMLRTRYATPWLYQLHHINSDGFFEKIFVACKVFCRVADGDVHDEDSTSGIRKPSFRLREEIQEDSMIWQTRLLHQCDKICRTIEKMAHAVNGLPTFDGLFFMWLKYVSKYRFSQAPMPSLVKLFSRESEIFRTQRQSTSLDQLAVQPDIDPWRVIFRLARESRPCFFYSLNLLCFLARSLVAIPRGTFKQYTALLEKYDTTLDDSLLLAKAVLCSSWMESADRQELLEVLAELHTSLSSRIVDYLKRKNQDSQCYSFLRTSLGACLLLYGCERNRVVEIQMIGKDDITDLAARRKVYHRWSSLIDPMIVDHRLMAAIEKYMFVDMDEVSSIVAMFLHSFMNDSAYLESFEIDNFIVRNGRTLAFCAWQFYGIRKYHEISNIRSRFLLRTLVVDCEPFSELLRSSFPSAAGWERSLQAVTRLFKVILDIISPAFDVEGRPWRSSLADIFYHFFAVMLSNEQEKIRVAVYTFTSSLLSAHFDAISLCWDAHFLSSSVLKRIKLVSFLVQLHTYFPAWKVLAWDTLLEGMSDTSNDEHAPLHGIPAVDDKLCAMGQISISPVSERTFLKICILLLSLHLIADGITVDGFTISKIRFHLAQALGFRKILAVPLPSRVAFHIQLGEPDKVPENAFPCIDRFFRLLDANHYVELPPSSLTGQTMQDDKPVTVLVGSVFLELFLSLFHTSRNLSRLPLVTVKNLLEALGVIIYKYDFESRLLRHLQRPLRDAISRVLDFLSENTSYVLCHLALSVAQAFVKRWHNLMGSLTYRAIDSAIKLAASQEHANQDALVNRALSLVVTTMTICVQNGFCQDIFKRQLFPEFFTSLKNAIEIDDGRSSRQNLRESLHPAIFRHLVDLDHLDLQVALRNASSYVEIVSDKDYNPELLLYISQQLSCVSRRISEIAPGDFDANPILSVLAALISRNKTHSSVLLPCVVAVLPVLLQRSAVTVDNLNRLLKATEPISRRNSAIDVEQPAHNVPLLLFEIMLECLRLKLRILPLSLKSMLDAVATLDANRLGVFPSMQAMVDPGINFLRTHSWTDISSDNDFSASLAVAKMLLNVASRDSSAMAKISDSGREKLAQTSLRIRAWNMLALATLLECNHDWAFMLVSLLSCFSRTYHVGMRIFSHQDIMSPEPIASVVNHAYIAIKLWVLIAGQLLATTDSQDSVASEVWNELWPPFEGLINSFEIETRAGKRPAISTLITSTVADLFIFLRGLQSPITEMTSTLVATLYRLSDLGSCETGTSRLNRTIRYTSEPPPEMSPRSMIDQIVKDIVAAEKLRILEGKTAMERKVVERQRKHPT